MDDNKINTRKFDDSMDELHYAYGDKLPTPDDVGRAFAQTAERCINNIKDSVVATLVPTRDLVALCVGMEAAVGFGKDLMAKAERDVPATIAAILYTSGMTAVHITEADMEEMSHSGLVLRAEMGNGAITYALVMPEQDSATTNGDTKEQGGAA